MRGWQALLVALAAGLIGVASAALLRGEAAGPEPRTPSTNALPTAPDASLDPLRLDMATLAEALEAEREAREALEQEVNWLREELARLEANPIEAKDPSARDSLASKKKKSGPTFDDDRLLAQNLERERVEELRERYDANRLDELYLRDQAAREGWIRTPRYKEELSDLRMGLREDLGDENYDYLLYAMGKDNRLVVGDVLKSSAAERAGLEPGDIVQRYDGERIFNKKELRTATTQGKSGSTVAVDVERDGSLQRFYLPRGPLGITLETVSLPPSSR
jgi:hypothetical protein